MKGNAKKVVIFAVLVAAVIVIIIGYIGYKEHRKSNYYLKEFTNDMKGKGYDVNLSDVNLNFLPTKSMKMSLAGKSDSIAIYLFKSEEEVIMMAGNIDQNGNYNSGSKTMYIAWTNPPAFFKKGCLIVQYTGTDSKVFHDLKDILGEPFINCGLLK